jgi:transcriptional regulator with XRE-family HTH domain
MPSQGVVMESTGKRIHDRRKQQMMSADKLAELADINRSTMFRYEKGDIKKVPHEVLYKIANALGTTVEYLLGETTEVSEKPLSVTQKQLIEYIKDLDEDHCKLLLPVVEAFRNNV